MPLPVKLEIFRTSLPMRLFEHAAASRDRAEAIVTRLQLDDGASGYGETLARQYVTGETSESVIEAIEYTLWPALRGQALEGGMSLPPLPAADADGKCINAALCAVELAALDAVGHSLPTKIAARVTGVLGSRDPSRTRRQLALMRLYGLRDFKLKLGLGDDVDAENLRIVQRRLGKRIAGGKCTLRVDANGAWDAASTPARVAQLRTAGVCAVEQPVFCKAPELVELAKRCELPLIADESLVTDRDADALLQAGPSIWWNVRISKNGGLTRALALCDAAERYDVPVVVGAMVGESGILSAAQRRLLQCARSVRFAEGNYGRLLLGDDLTRPSPRFGYGGRLRPLRGPGLGVRVDPNRLAQYGRLVTTLS